MKYLSLLWMRGLVRTEGEEENAPEGRGGERGYLPIRSCIKS